MLICIFWNSHPSIHPSIYPSVHPSIFRLSRVGSQRQQAQKSIQDVLPSNAFQLHLEESEACTIQLKEVLSFQQWPGTSLATRLHLQGSTVNLAILNMLLPARADSYWEGQQTGHFLISSSWGGKPAEQQEHYVLCVWGLWSTVAIPQTLLSVWNWITIQNMINLWVVICTKEECRSAPAGRDRNVKLLATFVTVTDLLKKNVFPKCLSNASHCCCDIEFWTNKGALVLLFGNHQRVCQHFCYSQQVRVEIFHWLAETFEMLVAQDEKSGDSWSH